MDKKLSALGGQTSPGGRGSGSEPRWGSTQSTVIGSAARSPNAGCAMKWYCHNLLLG